jgi:hypothetical protein
VCGAAGAAALALLLYRMRGTIASLRGLRADDHADDQAGAADVTLAAAAPA